MALFAYIQDRRWRLFTCNCIDPTEEVATVPGLPDVNGGPRCILSNIVTYADSEPEVFSHAFSIPSDAILDLASNHDERAVQPAINRLLEECNRQSKAPKIRRDTSDLANRQEEVVPVTNTVVKDIALFI
jgi:hypothetical protein